MNTERFECPNCGREMDVQHIPEPKIQTVPCVRCGELFEIAVTDSFADPDE